MMKISLRSLSFHLNQAEKQESKSNEMFFFLSLQKPWEVWIEGVMPGIR